VCYAKKGFKGFRRVQKGSEGVQEGSEGFRRVQEGSEGFKGVQEGSEGFRRSSGGVQSLDRRHSSVPHDAFFRPEPPASHVFICLLHRWPEPWQRALRSCPSSPLSLTSGRPHDGADNYFGCCRTGPVD